MSSLELYYFFNKLVPASHRPWCCMEVVCATGITGNKGVKQVESRVGF